MVSEALNRKEKTKQTTPQSWREKKNSHRKTTKGGEGGGGEAKERDNGGPREKRRRGKEGGEVGKIRVRANEGKELAQKGGGARGRYWAIRWGLLKKKNYERRERWPNKKTGNKKLGEKGRRGTFFGEKKEHQRTEEEGNASGKPDQFGKKNTNPTKKNARNLRKGGVKKNG